MPTEVLPPGDTASHWLATWNWTARDSRYGSERIQTGCRIAWFKPGYGPDSPQATEYQLDVRRCVPKYDTITHDDVTIQLGHAIGDGVGLPLTSAITDEDVTDVFVAMNNLANDLKDVWAQGWKLDHLKLAPIGDWGKYPRDVSPHIAVPVTQASTNNTQSWTMSNAVAFTLGTSKRGRGSTGRMYWPYASAVSVGFMADIGAVARGKVALFVEKIANPPGGLDVGRWGMRVIVGRRATLGLTAPYHRGSVVNHVRFGDRVDTQRRRMNSRNETYQRHEVLGLD